MSRSVVKCLSWNKKERQSIAARHRSAWNSPNRWAWTITEIV